MRDSAQDAPEDRADAGAKGDDSPDRKTQWAEDRTDWAEDRTLLANERTFAGWVRTGAACVGIALGLHAVFPDTNPVWAAKAVATLFLVAAAGIFASAAQQSHRAQTRIREHSAEAQPPRRMAVLAALLVLGTTATGAILWTI